MSYEAIADSPAGGAGSQDDSAPRTVDASLADLDRLSKLGRWELDHRTNELTWSDMIFEIFEIDPRQFGASYSAFVALVHPDDRQMVDDAYRNSLANGKPYRIEHRLLMKDGRVKWVSEACLTQYDQAGNAVKSTGVVQDITDRRAIEEALRDSEAKYRDMAGNVPGGVYQFMTDAAGVPSIPYMSEGGARLFERPREDLTKAELLFEGVHPEDLAGMRETIARSAAEMSQWAYEFRLVFPDGRVKWLKGAASPSHTEKGILWNGVLIDISELKRAEEELAESHQFLENEVSRRTQELSQANEQLRLEMAEREHALQQLEASECRYRKLIDAVDELINLGAYDVSSGSFFALMAEGLAKVLGADCLTIARSRQEGRSVETLAFVIDDILHDNIQFELLDRPCEKVIRNGAYVCRSGLQQEYPRDTFLIEQRLESYAGQVLLTRKGDPTGLVCALFRRPLADPAFVEKILKLFSSLIAGEMERLDNAQAAELQQRRLMRSEHLASLGTLVAGVAHEINNPTQYIMVNAGVARDVWRDVQPILRQYAREHGDFTLGGLEYQSSGDAIASVFAGTMDGARRIERLVKELKNFSRDEMAGVSDSIDFNSVCSSAVTLTTNIVKKATDNFRLTLHPELPEITGSYNRLEQVLINLIQNACQALTDRKQAVTLSTRYDAATRRVICSVSDEGHGIPPELQCRVLEPFYTTKREVGGTGLGLPISARIVEDHCGTLTIRSLPEQAGTTVEIALPANKESR